METLKSLFDRSSCSAVYVCGGNDWKALVFTCREFIEYRVPDIVFQEPDVFVYVDNRRNYTDIYKNWENGILYEDNMVLIKSLKSRYIDSIFWCAIQCEVDIISKVKPAWCSDKIRRKHKSLLLINSDWRNFAAWLGNQNISINIGIGIADGCRLGGNKECANTINNLNANCLKIMERSKYWITDHFEGKEDIVTLYNGEYVIPASERFPFKFKKLALLSSQWGHYGCPPSLRGATLFEIVER